MRFALLGNHPDALEMACAFAESGRHQLAAFTAAIADDTRQRWGPDAKPVADLEEVLADPAIEAILVGGTLANRPQQLRRALQSEHHVVCVQPPDDTPEIAYEAALIQRDTGRVLLPLLPLLAHPAVARLAQLLQRSDNEPNRAPSPLGMFRVLEIHWTATGELLENINLGEQKPSFPGWEVLRRLGGEIAEVTAFAEREDLRPGAAVFISGRFELGGLFQMTLLPSQPTTTTRIAVSGTKGRAELLLPQSWEGPALLTWRDATEALHEEAWERWDPWPALVAEFETAVALSRKTPDEQAAPTSSPLPCTQGRGVGGEGSEASTPHPRPLSPEYRGEGGRGTMRPLLTWQDTVRAVELDDAARRSVEKRRSSLMEYQEASEEVSFKGTMTLAGCFLIWLLPLVLLATALLPGIRWYIVWLVVAVLVVFLGLQLLRHLIPK